MEPHSTFDHMLPGTGAEVRAHADAASSERFPAEDGSRSLGEMAQRDLDAALQLLADRAQYITGASGAAIALRRDGKKDMLCRASAGANAPELGALLSTEFGLSGESVRTRQPLRCDDAERDVRVNREVCRQMGIASVVVMPVVNDDEVLGVFELFSGKANAFGARDVSAVERLSEMVETAVRLAQATVTLPERLKMKMSEVPAPEVKAAEVAEDQGEAQGEDQVLDGEVLEDVFLLDPVPQDLVLQGVVLEDAVLEERKPAGEVEVDERASAAEAPKVEALKDEGRSIAAPEAVAGEVAAAPQVVAPEVVPAASVAPATAAPAKKLFWSAAPNPAADAGRQEEADQSHVPPVLRSLRKCEACGFPVSAGRALCVECEEKKWRGQLRVPKAAPGQTAMAAPVVERRAEARLEMNGAAAALQQPKAGMAAAGPVAVAAKAEGRAFAAAAQSTAAGTALPSMVRASAAAVSSGAAPGALPVRGKESQEVAEPRRAVTPSAPAIAERTAKAPAPEFVLSAGMEPSQSWLAANKYILGVLLAIGGAGAVVFFFVR